MSRRAPLVTAVVLIFVATASAGPLKPDRISADATWLMHVDIETARDSTLGRFVIEHQKQLDLNLDEVRDETGIAVERDILSFTVYGDDEGDEDHVAVLVMTDAVDGLIDRIAQAEGYSRIDHDGLALHRWSDEEKVTYAWIGEGRGPGEPRLVVLSSEAAAAVEGVRVIQGQQRTLADVFAEAQRLGAVRSAPAEGSLLYAWATGLPWMKGDEPAGRILQRSNRMQLELREQDQSTTAELIISAKSVPDATNITDVLRGLIALGRLVCSSEPRLHEASTLLQEISIAAVVNDVRVQLQTPNARLEERLEECLDAHQMASSPGNRQ